MGETRYVGPEVADRKGRNGNDTGNTVVQSRELIPPGLKEGAPLSCGQLRLWFLEQLEPGTALYNMPMALRLKGKLDRSALQRAMDALVTRHESFRTRFVCNGEYPLQVVDQETAVVDMEILEAVEAPNSKLQTPEKHQTSNSKNAASAAAPEVASDGMKVLPEQVERLIREEINRPFDLGSGRLLRVKLIRVADEEHVLIVTMHHIVSDEWSLRIFFEELGELYKGYAHGNPAILPESPMRYRDYAVQQHEWMSGEALKTEVEHWRQKLAGRQGMFEIMTDRPRDGVARFRGKVIRRELGQELTQQCRALEKQRRVTAFMLHLAAFKALLSRYTQQQDIIVGCPVAGRSEVETEAIIGFFVNTILLRTHLSGDASFSDWLREVRQATIESYGHQNVPIEKLVEELAPERSLSHLPFTHVMFVMQNALFERAAWGSLEVEYLDVATDTAKFDLTFLVQGSSKGLIACVEYDSDLFEAGTIERLLEHYEILLRAAVNEPQTAVSQLPLMSEVERRLVLESWNATQTAYPSDKTIQELFESQAQATPSATAVRFGETSLTYSELNGRANQLARYLRKRGVDSGKPVAICAERSADAIVAMVAALKAGGAYVPLDPEYPVARLEYMLRDAGSPVLLTQQRLLGRIPGNCAEPICIDGDWELIARESKENLDLGGSGEQLAYVMYTSGSTGQPKGVAVPHRGVTRLVLQTNYIQLGPDDRIAQVSNVSFDAATFEIWGALLNGGQLIGIRGDVILSPRDFARALKEENITAMFLTAALFNQVASDNRDAFETLKTLIVGGEALDPKWIGRVLRGKGPARLVNGYGPTENTTFTCCHLIQPGQEERWNIPIGRPISNTRVYILDRNLNPLPVGVPGELCAAGDGLAVGYWNQPELTAERFICSPFATSGSQERLYKTGDLARFLPNGDIEFLGRLDDQVKVRGFRIELGEVEATLGRFPGVKNCAAKVCGTSAEHKRLVAYYVPGEGQNIDLAELRAFMREALPAHMQPAAYVSLASLPLTPNGKVDRNALPAPDSGRPAQERNYIAPRDRVEQQLAEIWEEVLGVSPIGIEDRFFDLGGHSLLAVRLVSRIEATFGKKLRLSTIFQAPRIQELSPILRGERKESSITARSSVVEIQGQGTRKPLFLVHGAGGGIFPAQWDPKLGIHVT